MRLYAGKKNRAQKQTLGEGGVSPRGEHGMMARHSSMFPRFSLLPMYMAQECLINHLGLS